MAGKKRQSKKETIAPLVLKLMSEKGFNCTKACKEVGILTTQFFKWMDNDEELREAYARARDDVVAFMANEIMEISDEEVPYTPMGTIDNGAIQKQKLRVDTRKWLLSKIAPKQYGDKLQLAGDGENPVLIEKIERVIIDKSKD